MSACELTDTYSPAAIDIAPATKLATPATNMAFDPAPVAATPSNRLAVDTIPDVFATLGNVTADLTATGVVAKGVPLGTALAFLLSAVGVSFPELVLLRSVMTLRLILAFAVVVLFGTTAIGWLFNALHFMTLR